jgi:hypothetical protein
LCSSGLLAAGKLHAAALLCLSFFPFLFFLECSNPDAVSTIANQTAATPKTMPFSHTDRTPPTLLTNPPRSSYPNHSRCPLSTSNSSAAAPPKPTVPP